MVFLYLLRKKIEKLEYKISSLFRQRASLIPSLFDVSESHLNRHSDIFHEIVILRKQEMLENDLTTEVGLIIDMEKMIHHELNFIFKVCNKHPKLLKIAKFVYIRDLFIDTSYHIGKNISVYKDISEKYNQLLKIKNYSVLGLLFPIAKKMSI